MLTSEQLPQCLPVAIAAHFPLSESLDRSFDTPTVSVVEDDPNVSNLLCRLLSAEGIKTDAYLSAEAFLDGFSADRPGCILLDISMPGMTGIDLHRVLTARGLNPTIIYLSGSGNIATVTQAMCACAVDFIQKPYQPKVLLARVEEAIQQDRQIRTTKSKVQLLKSWLTQLTGREREVMELLTQGKTTKSIASTLTISPKTVDNHRKKVFEKLRVENSTELANLLFLRQSS